MSCLARGGNFATQLIVSRQAIPCVAKPITNSFAVQKKDPIQDVKRGALTTGTISAQLPQARASLFSQMTASRCIGAAAQVRYVHYDVKIPDMSDYRNEKSKSPTSNHRASADDKKGFTYLMVAGATIPCVYGTKALVADFLSVMGASADVLALAKIEINLNDVPEGKSATFKWRNKPLFVCHRTAEAIETEANVDISTLRDPQTDAERAIKPEWLIVIGVCTHLGCVPIANAGEYNGYYCPCHGSHYDGSGRIRKGPAPANLEVPVYNFTSDDVVVVG